MAPLLPPLTVLALVLMFLILCTNALVPPSYTFPKLTHTPKAGQKLAPTPTTTPSPEPEIPHMAANDNGAFRSVGRKEQVPIMEDIVATHAAC